MYIPYSCAYVENGTVNYIFDWSFSGLNEQPADQHFSGYLISNGVVYPKTGDISKGIPGFDNKNFYSVFGA